MSTIVDNNIVSMVFDNENFEKNVKQTLNTIKKLKESLNFDGFEKGLETVKNGMTAITVKTTLMEKAVTAAVQRMATKVTAYGENMIKSLSVDQITAGWEKYAEKTTGVQTIMAATGKSIEEVNASLEKLNWFTDETSYNFTDMVTNIGKFTSQGIDLDTAVSAMEGISTWAAVSGQGVNEASRAMYNLAQAIGVGSVKLMDWKSIENANMGTKEFKEQAIAAAVAAGTLGTKMSETGETLYYAMDKSGKKMTKTQVTFENFSQTLSEGWFTSDVLISVLKEYGAYADGLYDISDYVQKGVSKTTSEMIEDLDSITDATTDAEIIQMGYTEDAIEKIRELASTESVVAKKSFKAAQEAKTFAEAINSVKDAVSTGWMTTFEHIFGNYEQAKRLWTDLANDLYDVFAEGGNERNEMLAEWTALEEGGRDDLIHGFKDLFEAVNNVRTVIKDAFHGVFPKKSAEDIAEVVKRFKAFAENIKNSTSSIERFKNGLRGIFSFVKIIKSVISQVAAGMKEVFGSVAYKAFDKALDIFDAMGDKLQRLYVIINQTSTELGRRPIQALAAGLADVLSVLYKKIEDLVYVGKTALNTVFGRTAENNTKKLTDSTTKFVNVIKVLLTYLEKIKSKIASFNPNELAQPILDFAFKVKDIFDELTFIIPNFFKALKGESYAEIFSEGWEESESVLDKFGRRLIALADIFNYYYMMINGAEHKGAAVIDAIKDVWQSVVWAITGSTGDIATAFADFAKTMSTKFDTKMLDWFGDYWLKISKPVKVTFISIKRILGALKAAIIDVFGPTIQEDLFTIEGIIKRLIESFKNFIKALYVTEDRADLLRRTFRGIFSVINMVKKAMLEYWNVITGSTASAASLIDVILSLTAAIGDWLYALDQTLTKNGTIEKIVDGYFTIFRELGRIISEVIGVISSFFAGFFGIVQDDGTEPIDEFGEALEDAEGVISPFGEVLDKAADSIQDFGEALKGIDFTKAREKASGFGDKFAGIVNAIKDKLELAGGFILGFPEVIKELFDKIKQKVDEKYPEVKSKFDEIKDKILEIWEDIKGLADSILGDIKDRFAQIGGFFKDLGSDIKGLGEKIKGAVDDIGQAFNDFSTIFSDTFNKIKGFFEDEEPAKVELIETPDEEQTEAVEEGGFLSKLLQGFKDLYPKTCEAIETYLPAVKDFFTKVGDVFKWIGENVMPTVKELFADVTFGDLLKVVTTGGLALAIKGLGDAVDGITDIVKDKFSGFAGGASASSFRNFAKSLLDIALAMGIIALIPDNEIERVTLTVAKLSIALLVIFGMMTTSAVFMASQKVNPKLIKNIGTVILDISIMMLVVASALAKLSTIPDENLRRAVGALEVVMITLAGMLVLITKTVGDMKSTDRAFKDLAKFVKALGLLVIELAIAGLLFRKLDWEDLGKMAAAFGGFMLILTLSLAILDTLFLSPETVKGFTKALKSLMGAFAVFAIIGALIQGVDFSSLLDSVVYFGLLIAELVGALFLFKNLHLTKDVITDFTGALYGLIGAFALFSAVGYLVQNIDFLGILKALGVFALVLVTLVGALVLFKALKIDSSVVTAFAIALVALSASFLIFAAAIYTLVAAVEKFVTLLEEHPQTVQTALDMMKGAIASFIEVIVGAIRNFVVQIATAIFDIMKYIADNMPVFTELLTAFLMILIDTAKNVLPEFYGLFETFLILLLNTIITVLPIIFEIISIFLDGLLDLIDNHIEPFIEVVAHFIKALADSIVDLAEYISDKIYELVMNMLDFFEDKVPKVVDKFFKVVLSIIKGVVDALIANAEDIGYTIAYALGGLVVVALKALKGLILGSSDIGSQISDAASELGEAVMDKLFGGVKDFLEGAGNIFGKIGDGISGVAGKITDGAVKLVDGVTDSFETGWDNLLSFFGVHSPSKKMEWFGDNLMAGLNNGLEDGFDDVSTTTDSISTGLFGKLTDALSTIKDAIDFDVDLSPTITPVLDLTEFDAGLDEMDGMFEDSNTSKSLNLSGLSSVIGTGTIGDVSSISSLMSDADSGQNGIDTDSLTSQGTTINLTQNNYSPEALSRTDIYRQTKNLLSTMQQSWGMT